MNPAADEAHGAAPVDHDHVVGLQPALDFINTLAYDDGVPRDALGDVEGSVGFLANVGVAHAEALRAQADADGAAWLARVRAFRAGLREAFDAHVEGRPVEPGALDVVNAVLRARPQPELRVGPHGLEVGHRHVADATGEALARLAEALLDAVAAGEAARFRICANDRCRWVFHDTSRGGRRRWCDMAEANRAKVARFRARQRAAG